MAIKGIVNQNARFIGFSAEGQDLVEGGVNLFKHFAYMQNPKDENIAHYAEFATGNYREKEELFMDNLEKEAVKRFNLNMTFERGQALKKDFIRKEAFAIMGEILDIVLPMTVADSMGQFVDVRNLAWGDSMIIEVANNDLFTVSELGDGIAIGKPQRLQNNQVVLTPTNKNVTIEEDFYRVLAGKVNLGNWLVRVAISYQTKIYTDIYKVLSATYTTLPAELKEANFTQDGFVNLANKVTAMNAGAKAVVFGTQVALSKLIPQDQYFKFGLGTEYNKNGYLGEYMGVSLIKLPNVVKPNTDGELLLDDATVIVASQGAEKLIMMGFEGESIIIEREPTQNASLLFQYSFNKKYDLRAVSSFRHGMMKVV